MNACMLDLVLLFFFYSFLGWCIEVVGKLIQYHRFINRGFLTGPICPIYGFGAILITLTIRWIAPLETAVGTTFVISFLLCGALEYLTSWYMEKRFHARWWDYSRKPMNLHGRIWIGNLILFGLGGVAIIHVVNPLLMPVLGGLSLKAKEILCAGLLVVFAADFVMTHFVMKLIRIGVEHSEADSTEAVNREIRTLLSDRNIFYRRFADAYPEVIYRTERIKARVEKVKAETERLRRDAEQRLNAQKAQLVSAVEPATRVKSAIIANQERLISLLYDDKTATDEMKALKQAIETDRQRLDDRPLKKIADKIS